MGREPVLLLARAFFLALLSAPAASAQAPAAQAPSSSAQTPAESTAAPAAELPSDDDTEASVQLFREGRALLNKGRFREACERFQAALELRRSPGTLLNVGNCLQSQGDLVGALKTFEETAALARAEPDARKAEVWSGAARDEIEALRPRIPSVVVHAPADPSVEVRIDGQRVAAFDEPRALNPGRYHLLASAPGKLDFQRELVLEEGRALSVDVPPLEPAGGASAAALAAASGAAPAPSAGAGAADVAHDEAPSRVVPWTLVGVGGAALAGGLITGLVAAQRASDLEEDCPNRMCEGDLSQRDAAHDTAVVADVLMGAGLVVAAAGVTWLVLTSDADSSTSVSAACVLNGCGASLRGSF